MSEKWVLNHAAMIGLWNEDLISFESEGRLVHPDVALVTAPQHLTIRVGAQLLDVVNTDIAAQVWELRSSGSM